MKPILIVLSIFISMPAALCQSGGQEYYPVSEGSYWKYEWLGGGTSGHSAQTIRVVEFDNGVAIMEFSMQLGTNSPPIVNYEVIQVDGGKARIMATKSRNIITGSRDSHFTYKSPPEKFLDFPLTVGKKWSSGDFSEWDDYEVISYETKIIKAGSFKVCKIKKETKHFEGNKKVIDSAVHL